MEINNLLFNHFLSIENLFSLIIIIIIMMLIHCAPEALLDVETKIMRNVLKNKQKRLAINKQSGVDRVAFQANANMEISCAMGVQWQIKEGCGWSPKTQRERLEEYVWPHHGWPH